ncbi:hypothetical protein HK405_004480 [Cladochytrium tenue]|nr:hypothetical protein HK405_004480 [Cladochytrium tenue]
MTRTCAAYLKSRGRPVLCGSVARELVGVFANKGSVGMERAGQILGRAPQDQLRTFRVLVRYLAMLSPSRERRRTIAESFAALLLEVPVSHAAQYGTSPDQRAAGALLAVDPASPEVYGVVDRAPHQGAVAAAVRALTALLRDPDAAFIDTTATSKSCVAREVALQRSGRHAGNKAEQQEQQQQLAEKNSVDSPPVAHHLSHPILTT